MLVNNKHFWWSGMKRGLTVGLMALVAVSCGDDEDDDDDDTTSVPTQSIAEIAGENEDLETLVALLTTNGLATTFAEDAPSGQKFVVFAPTDAAFETAGISADAAASDAVANTLRYHVLQEAAVIRSTDITNELAGTTIYTKTGATEGEKLWFFLDNGTVCINAPTEAKNCAKVTTANVEATNGIVHVIDKVLTPDDQGTLSAALLKRPNFQTLYDQVVAAELATTVDGFTGTTAVTLFAPTDDAFATALADTTLPVAAAVEATDKADLGKVLQYHIIPSANSGNAVITSTAVTTEATADGPVKSLLDNTGTETNTANSKAEPVWVNYNATPTTTNTINNGAKVVATALDITVAGGSIIHGIDKVLIPNQLGNVVQALAKSPIHTTLVTLVTDTNIQSPAGTQLATTLSGTGPFTVFAPNDTAFTRNFGATAAQVYAAGTFDTVRDVLLYHVLGGTAAVLSTSVVAAGTTGATLDTLLTASGTPQLKAFLNSGAPTLQFGTDLTVAPSATNTAAIDTNQLDIVTTNGVVHVIADVMNPNG